MKETELKAIPCYCGGEMVIKKTVQHACIGGTYWDWELKCKKCGFFMTSSEIDEIFEILDEYGKERKII